MFKSAGVMVIRNLLLCACLDDPHRCGMPHILQLERTCTTDAPNMSLRMALPLVFCKECTSYFGSTTKRINQTVAIEFRAGKNIRESTAVGNRTYGTLDVHEIV